MRVVTIQLFWGQKFERELRETLQKEMPVEAEVHVAIKPGSQDLETRVVFDGSSATRTVGVQDVEDRPAKGILEIVRELAVMLPNRTPSSETNGRSAAPDTSENHSNGFRPTNPSNGFHKK